MRLAAWLRPDSLGELQFYPDTVAAIRGGVLLLRGRERREKEKGKGQWRN